MIVLSVCHWPITQQLCPSPTVVAVEFHRAVTGVIIWLCCIAFAGAGALRLLSRAVYRRQRKYNLLIPKLGWGADRDDVDRVSIPSAARLGASTVYLFKLLKLGQVT